ncbi:MAG TPA: TolC family protein [Gemmatimonadaceae bacterium]
MRMSPSRLVVISVLCTPLFLSAQQPSDGARPISLEEAVRLAQLNSPVTVSARNALRTGKLNEMYALGQYLPSLNISYGASNSSGGQFIQGELVPYKGYPWNYGKGYSASLLLFDGGQRWFSYLQAQANQRANGENETLQRYFIAYTVKQQYYSVLQARELEAAGASALEQAQVALNASSARVKVGAVVRTDSLRAAIQVGSARLSLLNARAQLRDANAALTRLVASNVPVTAVAADTSDVPRIDVDDASLSRMADDGPNVRQAIASFDAAKQGRRATITSQFLPRVSANYNYSANAFPTPDFNWGGGPSASKQTFYSFGLSYAIFNNFSRELNTMVATVAEDNAEAALRDARFNAKANLAQLMDQFRTAAQTIELQQLQITAAQEDLAAQQSRYALGASSYLDLLTSQTALDSQRILLIGARFQARTAKAAIEAFIGRDLK